MYLKVVVGHHNIVLNAATKSSLTKIRVEKSVGMCFHEIRLEIDLVFLGHETKVSCPKFMCG